MTINEFLVESCREALNLQGVNGTMPAGHNGPYIDQETPVRNTAHWCNSFIRAYELTNENQFYDAALKCGEYLRSKEARPMGSVYFCRKNPKKDFANGLVGQAWVIEALVRLEEMTQDSEYSKLAVDVFKMHPYDSDYNAWFKKNVDGSLNGFDKTFNHELWFAAAGSLLVEKDKEIKKQVFNFLNHIDVHLELYADGCIKHSANYFLDKKPEEKIKKFIIKAINSNAQKEYLRMISVGYHSFNTYAFAIIKQRLPDLNVWESKKISEIIKYTINNKYFNAIEGNKFGLPYNVTGFEVPFTLEIFKQDLSDVGGIIETWLNRQINFGLKKESFLLTENSKDPNTSAARIYEITRLSKNYNISIL